MTITTDALPKTMTFKLSDWNADETGGRPYLATVECDAKQIRVVLASNDKRADLTATIEISNGIPAIHLSDAYGIESALSIRANKDTLSICPSETAELLNNNSEKYNHGSPFGARLPINDQADAAYASMAGDSESANHAEIDLLSAKVLHGTLSDYSDDVAKPYSVSATIQAQGIDVELFSSDQRPGIAFYVEIDRAVPAIHFSSDGGTEMALHIHATMNGLYVCPEANIEMKRIPDGLGNAVYIPLERYSADEAISPALN